MVPAYFEATSYQKSILLLIIFPGMTLSSLLYSNSSVVRVYHLLTYMDIVKQSYHLWAYTSKTKLSFKLVSLLTMKDVDWLGVGQSFWPQEL